MSRISTINGLPVLDAKRPLRVRVQPRDIAKAAADTKNPAGCAVARACYRELGVQEARIHLGRIYLRTNQHNWVRYKTPAAMRQEIIAFDRGGAFQPQEFELRPPTPEVIARPKASGQTRKQSRKATRRAKQLHVQVANVRSGPAAQS